MDFALKTVRGLECSAFAAQVWALWYLKSPQLFLWWSLTLQICLYSNFPNHCIHICEKNQGPSSLITKPSVKLWSQCENKNTVSVMIMLANPFWLIIPEISPVYTEELHLTFIATLCKLLRKNSNFISLHLQHLVWWLDRKIPGENVHKMLEDGISSEINWF